ncbi:MAG: hypothetical protein EHM55_21625 [Acidobacteria bacterium]|nr:MAG: hypothetical protein EHM55_21625 [Acidobacteriota bacterium]
MSKFLIGVLLLLTFAVAPATAAADERYALIVSGASGSEKFAESQKGWVSSLQSTLQKRLGFAAERVIVLSESGAAAALANRDNVTRTLASLKPKLTGDDMLLIVLIGHGTFDGTAAKFNLVGPDMDSNEWKASLEDTPARLVFVNTTSASSQFVQALSGKNRIVIAATDSPAQKYATMFPQYFIEALDQGAKADNDKNGRLSVWEVFTYASQAVKQAFEQKGTLVTERSIIDDNGDGVGKEAAAAAAAGGDGVLARTTFLDPLSGAASANPAVAALDKRRIAIEVEIEQLKARKGDMPAGQYEEEFERLAIELAKISAQIRSAK